MQQSFTSTYSQRGARVCCTLLRVLHNSAYRLHLLSVSSSSWYLIPVQYKPTTTLRSLCAPNIRVQVALPPNFFKHHPLSPLSVGPQNRIPPRPSLSYRHSQHPSDPSEPRALVSSPLLYPVRLRLRLLPTPSTPPRPPS